MKRPVLLTALLFLSATAIHSQSFTWAKRAGLWAYDLGHAIGSDAAGNVFIAGKYEMNANFGGITVGCAGNHDIYVAKYNSSGTIQWVRTAGGSSGDYAHALAVDPQGNVYISGEMEGTVTFTPGVTLTSNGDNDIFVAKYNGNGGLLWARKLGGGSLSDKALGMSYSNGCVYLTGRFQGNANFAGVSMSSYGGKDIFIAKYSDTGVFQWVKRAGGSGSDEGAAIANDPAGNIFVTGWFSGTANFSGITVTSKGAKDLFVAKYNSSGTPVWVKKNGGQYDDFGLGIKVDASNRVFVTGSFRYKAAFGTTTLTSTKAADIFVARYDNSGNVVWAKKAGGNYEDEARALAIDGSSNIYITGNYGYSCAFGSTTISGADSSDVFFAAYDVSGNFKWALKAGGAADPAHPGKDREMGLSLATDPSGNVLGSGTYRANSTFGNTTLSGWANTDIFIVKISPTSIQSRLSTPSLVPSDSASFCTGGYVDLRAPADSTCEYRWIRNGKVMENITGAQQRVNTPGTYQVMIIRGEDTLLSKTTVIHETTRMEATITARPGTFCRDSANILRANAGDGLVYQWKRNGRLLNGSTSPTLQATREGNYQVKIIQGSCVDWSSTFNVEFASCGPDSADQQQVTDLPPGPSPDSALVMKVFPNPNNGLFTLNLNMGQLGDDSKKIVIELFNSTGQPIFNKVMPVQQTTFNEQIILDSSVRTGVYILKVSIGDLSETTRILLLR